MRVDPAGDVGGHGQLREGHPAGEDDVDEHEGFGGGGVDEDVSGEVVGAFVGEVEGLVADVEGFVFFEDDVREGPEGIEGWEGF